MWFGSQKNVFYLYTDSLKNDTITTGTHAWELLTNPCVYPYKIKDQKILQFQVQ